MISDSSLALTETTISFDSDVTSTEVEEKFKSESSGAFVSSTELETVMSIFIEVDAEPVLAVKVNL